MADLPQPTDFAGRLRAMTIARVGIGRVGSGVPTSAMLEFQLAHARARDAVHAEIASGAFGQHVNGLPVVEVRSQAVGRQEYLMRPDLGRRLAANESDRLRPYRSKLAIVIADGLSAAAVRTHAAALVGEILVRAGEWSTRCIVVAHQARVALGDEIGEAMSARLVIVLIGERPGLSATDSVSAYVTWEPRRGRMDSERNCISNIRPPHGLSLAEAAHGIMTIAASAKQQGRSGVMLNSAIPALPALQAADRRTGGLRDRGGPDAVTQRAAAAPGESDDPLTSEW